MALTKITKSGITNSAVDNNKIEADAVDATKIADNAISEEHLDTTVFTGNTELSEAAASNDILLVYDTSAGTIKKILASNVGTQAVTLSSVSPTNALTGDGTGNHTFTITGTNLTGASAVLITDGGTEVNFDSVTVDSSTQITAVIAKSSISNANEPYDIKVYGSNGLTAVLRDQINVDASPTFVTASGSLGDSVLVGNAGSFSVNATDPESAGNVTFELQSGSLPPGYSITNTAAEGGTAIISGTDNTTSSTTTFNFVLRAIDAASNTSSRSFSITSRVLVSESFTSSGTFSVPSGITQGDVLVVAGGGGSNNATTPINAATGGSGAGGLIFVPGYPLTPGGTVTVTVGDGGPLNAAGQDSVFATLTAKGGGRGGGSNSGSAGASGGSGGGGTGGFDNPGPTTGGAGGGATQPTQPGQSGAYGFGNSGGSAGPFGAGRNGGGGGGAGAVGGDAYPGGGGAGGNGKAYTIADGTTPVGYAGGGGGGGYNQPARGGNPFGGGQGGGTSASAQPGVANRGGGGGGGGKPGPMAAGTGGKGIVIVRY